MSTEITEKLLDAALSHVPFDGWSETTMRAAIVDTGIDPTVARALFPRGAVDLALAYHRRGDALMEQAMAQADLGTMRYRDRVAFAVRKRLEAVEDREVVRRGTTLFSLPLYAADGARAIWGTADRIWTALGDTSDDINWYTKRATLAGVYSATVLFWLGDDSPDHQNTWAFLDRRIDDVMQIEKVKGQMRKAPGLGPLVRGVEQMLGRVRPPTRRSDLPGQVGGH
ncbi:MAG: COQ9 family protein [Roseivivax sp.]|nr:COQ9 family protein [Roseivivax sp.]